MRKNLSTAASLILLLLTWSAPAGAEPPWETRENIVCRAQSGVGFSYWYAKSCWCGIFCSPNFDCDPGGCSGSCPDNCNHWGAFGADCSGFVNKVWQVPGPVSLWDTCSHGPYVAKSYTESSTHWDWIPREQLIKGDALGSAGHVVLYEGGDPWGSMWLYEAMGCVKGIVHGLRPLSNDYSGARRHNIKGNCDPYCEGNIIHDENCNAGDCGVFGSSCVDDVLGVRCVFYMCPAIGSKTVCLTDTKIGQCTNGAIQEVGDCGVYGCYCSTAGGTEPHCVLSLCVDSPNQIPYEHDICYMGEMYHCDAAGGLAKKPCGAGKACVDKPTPHCEASNNPCPPSGEADICLDDATIAHCKDGNVVSSGSCAAYGAYCHDDALGPRCVFWMCPPVGTKTVCLTENKIAECTNGAVQETGDCGVYGCWCSTAGGTEPHCVLSVCVASPNDIPWEHDICFEKERYHCDASGGIAKVPCPSGQVCVDEPTPHCESALGPNTCPPSGEADICLDDGTIAHCKGGKVTSSGSCAMYGAYCVNDSLGARCVFYMCPPMGHKTICLDDHQVADCDNGALKVTGDCSVYGCWCSMAGGTEGHCVLAVCVESPDDIPVAHDICFDGKRWHCDAAGMAQEVPKTAESCNGFDDDCNGSVDEGYDLGAACSAGQGPCQANGKKVCSVNGTGTACDAEPLPGTPELCNQQDDDCNGEIDETFSLGAPCVAGQGGCATAGVTVCAPDGKGVACDALLPEPGPEACNGLDDDCNGEVDEGFGTGVECTVGEGACLSTGAVQCLPDGTGAECSAEETSCDDGNPCTDDYCSPASGCVNDPKVSCCASDGDCLAGTHCVEGTCVCGETLVATCDGDKVVLVDECGTVAEVKQVCENGCAAAKCCPAGTHPEEGECKPTTSTPDDPLAADEPAADVVGEDASGPDSASVDGTAGDGASGDVASSTDAGGDSSPIKLPVDEGSTGRKTGGCAAGGSFAASAGSTAALLPAAALLLVLAALARMRFRRQATSRE